MDRTCFNVCIAPVLMPRPNLQRRVGTTRKTDEEVRENNKVDNQTGEYKMAVARFI